MRAASQLPKVANVYLNGGPGEIVTHNEKA